MPFPAAFVAVVLRALLQIAVCLSSIENEFSTINAVMPTSPTCAAPTALGMETGELPDEWLFASSSFHLHGLGPHNARIRNDRGGGAWCPREQIKWDSYEFIQVDFPSAYEILGVEVQGRHANGSGREWAEALVIDSLRRRWDGTNWTRYENSGQEQILLANRDQHSAVLIPLNPPLVAVSVRLVPFSAQLRTVCLRFELYGCGRDGTTAEQQQESGTDAATGAAVDSVPLMPPILVVLLLLSLVVLLLLLLPVGAILRRCAITPDQKGMALFGGSQSVGSPPLLPSSSWQNVRLPPFDTSNIKVYSPSFCRFDTVSLGKAPSARSSPPAAPNRWEEKQRRHIYYANFGAEENGGLLQWPQQQQHATTVTRSRSLHAAANIGTTPMPIIMPLQTAATVPVRPIQICQLAHSRSQPESFRAVTRPLLLYHQRLQPKPKPKPRRTIINIAAAAAVAARAEGN